LTASGVVRGLEAGLRSPRLKSGEKVEAAFYGGTFTALPQTRQAELLQALSPFLKSRQVHGIRLSTRPDALAASQVAFLKELSVTTVEIGAQSLDDKVLEASRRGHSAGDTIQAAVRVKEAGLNLGLQLMPGLPGEDQASLKATIEQVLTLGPADVRLYPCCVIKNTPLAGLYRNGAYRPMTLRQAVEACAWAYERLTGAGVNIIRLGLQDSLELRRDLLAGPHHPAFGHIVKAEVFYRAMLEVLQRYAPESDEPVLTVAARDLSQAQGHAGYNLARLSDLLNLPGLEIRPDPDLPRGRFRWRGETFQSPV